MGLDWGHELGRTHAFGCWLFARTLGLVLVVAHLSLLVQVRGLVGRMGILPAEDLFTGRRMGLRRFLRVPTVFWWDASDRALVATCIVGAVAGGFAAVGVLPVVAFAVAWASYLSLFAACQEFLGFQWDVLLLEATFLAILVSPLAVAATWPPSPPPALAVLLLWWLIVRLMISSGVVKLRSGDPTWRDLTALTVHHETQPLPTRLAWHAHHLPAWFHRASCFLMLGVELVLPLLVVGPPPVRHVAAFAIAGLMLAIMATGNYAFFNLLTIALCFPLISDWWWARLGADVALPVGDQEAWPVPLLAPVALALVALSAEPVARLLPFAHRWPGWFAAFLRALEPFRLVSSYGLFAVMTTTRPELQVEGSDDGLEWKPYAFRWKPGDLARAPRWCAPHQPRLDWQCWFAALRPFQASPWMVAFLVRLLQASPDVRALLREDPFGGRPPKYVRATLWRYRFTSREQRKADGTWWTREPLGLHAPPLMLDADGRPSTVEMRPIR